MTESDISAPLADLAQRLIQTTPPAPATEQQPTSNWTLVSPKPCDLNSLYEQR